MRLSRTHSILLGFAVLLVLVAALGYLYRAPLTQEARSLAAKVALMGARTVDGPFETRTLNEYGLLGRHEVKLALPGKLVDYARSGRREGALVFIPETRIMGIWTPGKTTLVGADATIKSSLSLSPDGTHAAYAALVNLASGTAFTNYETFYDPTRWAAQIVDLSNGTVTTLAPGYAPQYFTREGRTYILFTNGVGIRIMSVDDGERVDVVKIFATDGTHPARVSGDGRYAALYDASIGSYRIFKITALAPTLTLTETARYARTERVAFSGAHVVAAMRAHDGATAGYELVLLDAGHSGPIAPAFRTFASPLLPNTIIP